MTKMIKVNKRNAIKILGEKIERCEKKSRTRDFINAWRASRYEGVEDPDHFCPFCVVYDCENCPASGERLCGYAAAAVLRLDIGRISLREAKAMIREAFDLLKRKKKRERMQSKFGDA